MTETEEQSFKDHLKLEGKTTEQKMDILIHRVGWLNSNLEKTGVFLLETSNRLVAAMDRIATLEIQVLELANKASEEDTEEDYNDELNAEVNADIKAGLRESDPGRYAF